MHTQYCVKNKRLDGDFLKHKLGIEIDEYGHVDRNFEDEQSRQLMIEEKIGCKIVRINPDTPDFNINRVTNLVFMHIKQSTKKSLIEDLSKRLLELEFKSNHSVKSKCLKWIVKKNAAKNIKMTGKEYVKKKENTYCLVCKKKTDNKKIGRVVLVNKIATQCTVCTSTKSTFLKPVKPITNKTNKKQK